MNAMTEERLNLIAEDIEICGANVALHHSKELIAEIRRRLELQKQEPVPDSGTSSKPEQSHSS